MKLNDINIFKNRGLFKEGFADDKLSTAEDAYLLYITQQPVGATDGPYTNLDADTTSVGSGTGGTGATVDVIITNGTVTSLTVKTQGSGYKIGDIIKVDKSNFTAATQPLLFKITDTSPITGVDNIDYKNNNWGRFIGELLQLFILLILFSIIGANIVYISNLPMGRINQILPSDWNKPPYKGEIKNRESLFAELGKNETREDLLEYLFPMTSASFPYTYDNLYDNEELQDIGLAFYAVWPLKWLSRTTAWAYSTGRILIKYFIAVLKWIMTYIKSDTLTFFLGPFLIMIAISTQITTLIGTVLMYVGGFMTDVQDGWVLAIFALFVFIVIIGYICYTLYKCCIVPSMQSCSKVSEVDPLAAVAKAPAQAFDSTMNAISKQTYNFITLGFGEKFGNLGIMFQCLICIILIILAILSIVFSSIYHTANGLFMTFEFAIFCLIYLFLKNDGIALLKEIISKHIKGLTVIFILFSLAMARANLTDNISKSYIFTGVIVIISIIFSMFKKDKE